MAKPRSAADDSGRDARAASGGKSDGRDGDRGPRVDPYLEWAVATGFEYFELEALSPWIPVILELRGPAKDFVQKPWNEPHGGPYIRVPGVYHSPPSKLAKFRFCTALVRREFFRQLTNPASDLSKEVLRFEFGLPIITEVDTLAVTVKPPLEAPAVGTAVIGVIDDGFAFAHERFRTGDGRTRIEYLWDQNGPPSAVPQMGYGRELQKHLAGSGIDAVLAQCTYGSLVDEDEVYRVTKHEDYRTLAHKVIGRRGGHGTHVMDLAAGCDPAAATDSFPIVGVQLPNRTTRDTSGASLAVHVLDALAYILDRADKIALRRQTPALPVVVNLSYGTIAGPHDGSTILEAAIDQAIRLRNTGPGPVPFSVVIPSGNSHLSRCHARFALAAGKQRALHWRVQPDDRTPSFMEIWLPNPTPAAPDPKVWVRVISPSGQQSPWVKQGTPPYYSPTAGGVEYGIVYPLAVGSGNRDMILVALAPTATLRAGRPLAPAGTWKVLVKSVSTYALDVNAWIQRDDTPYGYPVHGRQSRFEDAAYERFDDGGREVEVDSGNSHVVRDGLINALATGTETVVIAGFRRKDERPARYSAGGPTVGARGGPDAMAVSDDSGVHRGVLAAGTRSGSIVALTGTSVAAPPVTRWIAEQMAANPPQPSDPAAVRQYAAAWEAARPSPKPALKRGGSGRIESDPAVTLPRFDPP